MHDIPVFTGKLRFDLNKIYVKIKNITQNYLFLKKWLLFEKALSEEINLPNISMGIQIKTNFEETCNWIDKIFYPSGKIPDGEMLERIYAKKFNHIFFSIWHEEKIIGFSKVGFNKVYINSLKKVFPLPPKTALVLAIFVLPDYRGKGVGLYTYLYIFNYLKKKGFNKVRAQINPNNIPAKKVAIKAGFHQITNFWQIRILNWNIISIDFSDEF